MMRGRGHSGARGLGMAAMLAAAACSGLGCGGGVQGGMQVAFDLFGVGEPIPPASGGPAPSGGVQPSQTGAVAPSAPAPAPQTTPVPPPAKPVPPDMLYGTDVLFQMREAGGSLKQAWAFRKFKDQKVAGQGTVLKVENKEFMGQVHVNVWLDVDGDDEVDIVLNYLNPGLEWFVGVAEGIPIWYDGVIKRYDERLYIGGTYIQPLF